MAIRQVKEVNRSQSYPIASGSIVGGMALALDTTPALSPWSHLVTTGHQPFGLAIESNVFFPLQPANGEVAGQGFDYTNFNRGGLESVYNNGGDFVIYDDGRGLPLENGTYAVNAPVYTSTNAATGHDGYLAGDTNNSSIIVGYVVQALPSPVNPTSLEIKLAI